MKTLKKLSLPSEEMRNLKGGMASPGTTPTVTTKPPITTTPKPNRPTCACSCFNCIWPDGGGGFSAGMSMVSLQ